MYITLTSPPPLTFPLYPPIHSPLFNLSQFSLKLSYPRHLRSRLQVHKIPIISPHNPQIKPSGRKKNLTFCFDQTLAPITKEDGEINNVGKLQLISSHRPQFNPNCFDQTLAPSFKNKKGERHDFLKGIAKPIAYALFYIAIGFFPIPYNGFRPALAIAAVAQEKKIVLKKKDHEYSNYTRALLEKVSNLVKCVEEMRLGDGDLKAVEAALGEVRSKKRELQDEIMSGLYAELRELKGEKEDLVKKSDELVESVMKAKKSVGPEDGEEEKLEGEVRSVEEKYNEIWDKIDEIEERIERREAMALSIGVREISFIERECEALVEKFRREMRLKSKDSVPKYPPVKLSRSEIQKELKNATRQLFEQMILPNVLEAEDIGYPFDQDSVEFAQRIKQTINYSRDLQSNMEAGIRKKMKKFGDEKRFVVNTPVDEVVKGFPDVELKWMFGDKEVVVPNAARLHLYHGWKKWREEAKADLKRKLLEDVDFGKKYVAERQEHIFRDRDRVTSKTWYNEERKRWEMDPIAVPYAVSRKLLAHAQIRHDWAAMHISIKGDEKNYFVDLKEFDTLFEDFGGVDGLYMRMLASGIPTAVRLMWIPFSELDIHQQFALILRFGRKCFTDLWRTRIVSYAREWALEKIKNINDDIMMMIVFPLMELLIPFPVRMQLGMAWPEFTDQSVGSTWYLKWQSEAEMSFRSRKTDDFRWYFWFLISSFVYGYVLFHLFRFTKRNVPKVLGYGPLRKDPNWRKLRRVKAYFKYRVKRVKRKRKAGVDPISTAFDQMKRVKNPPIRLEDFASVESMREEINEVVAFLQNPNAFKEMGARAPKGVLIVGERGTGKTSLALAIAAEAKVPLVEVGAQQLEAGLWVGQSASNVRELFQTARDLAPVIIFVEDFDLFAGVRGKFIHTKKQDHEAFINQLLVELDGFEKQDGVVLMATTRNLKQIDEALRRPGRMDRVFHLQPPTQKEREKILQISAKETMDEELIDFVNWRKVAEKTALLRPVELKLVPVALEGSAFRGKSIDTDELLSYVSWFATFSNFIPNWVRKTKTVKMMTRKLINHLGLSLTKEDLQNVVDLMEPYGQISNGMELLNPPLEWTRESKFPHAVWAAGRGLVTLLLPNFDVVDNLWLEPFSWEGIGCTKITKTKSEGSMNGNVESRSYLEKKLVFCFGSYVASQMLLPFGEENILSSSELKQAQEIATRMVIQYGWGPDDNPTIYHHGNAVTALSMGNNHEYEMAAKVEKIYDLAYDKAKEMLRKNREVLEKIVDELLEFEILTGKDLERVFESNGGIRENEPFFLSNTHEEPVFRSVLENGSVSAVDLLGSPN